MSRGKGVGAKTGEEAKEDKVTVWKWNLGAITIRGVQPLGSPPRGNFQIKEKVVLEGGKKRDGEELTWGTTNCQR